MNQKLYLFDQLNNKTEMQPIASLAAYIKNENAGDLGSIANSFASASKSFCIKTIPDQNKLIF